MMEVVMLKKALSEFCELFIGMWWFWLAIVLLSGLVVGATLIFVKIFLGTNL